jgi:hypothetical protein
MRELGPLLAVLDPSHPPSRSGTTCLSAWRTARSSSRGVSRRSRCCRTRTRSSSPRRSRSWTTSSPLLPLRPPTTGARGTSFAPG